MLNPTPAVPGEWSEEMHVSVLKIGIKQNEHAMSCYVNLDTFGFWVDKEKEPNQEAKRYSNGKTKNPQETAHEPHMLSILSKP